MWYAELGVGVEVLLCIADSCISAMESGVLLLSSSDRMDHGLAARPSASEMTVAGVSGMVGIVDIPGELPPKSPPL